MNLRRVANYLAASNTARLVLVLISSFMAGRRPADPVSVLIWGLLFDLAVVFVALRRDPPYNIISVKKPMHTLQKSPRDFIYALVSGAVWGILLLTVPAAIAADPSGSGALTEGATVTLVFVSAIFSIPVVGTEMMTNGSVFKRSKIRGGSIGLLFLGAFILAAVFSFSGAASGLIGGETLTLKRFALTLIPSAAALTGFEIAKAVMRKKNKV